MPEEEQVVEESTKKKSSGSGFKKIMMVATFALVAFMAFVYLQSSGMLNQLLGGREGSDFVEKPVEEVIYRFEQPFLVNMADRDILRYLKVVMAVGVTSRRTTEEIQQKNVEVRDAMIMVMSSKNSEDLAPPDGIEHLKVSLKERLNGMLRTGQVMSVYFLDLVMQ